jgi:hypothetical protein
MGYRAWQALGHQVRRGERSISILAPCTYKAKQAKQAPDADSEAADPDDDAEEDQPRRILRGFRIAHVFDVSQTDGDHITPPQRPALLEGDAPAGLWDTLAAQVHTAGYTLSRATIPSGANGVTNFASRTVTIADHLAAAQACKTLAHDLLTAPGGGPPLGRRDLFQWSRLQEEEGRDDAAAARPGRVPGCDQAGGPLRRRAGGDLDPEWCTPRGR